MKIDKVLKIDVSQDIEIGDETMSLYEASRWCALLQGLDVITKQAKRMKIDLDQDKTWIKPLALQKFVDEEEPGAISELKLIMDRQETN